jgi:hypothetical protein
LAPATHGDVLGKLIVMLGTQRVAERDLISLDDIAEGSYWHNLVDSVKLWLQDF